jgi:hypothetical protein
MVATLDQLKTMVPSGSNSHEQAKTAARQYLVTAKRFSYLINRCADQYKPSTDSIQENWMEEKAKVTQSSCLDLSDGWESSSPELYTEKVTHEEFFSQAWGTNWWELVESEHEKISNEFTVPFDSQLEAARVEEPWSQEEDEKIEELPKMPKKYVKPSKAKRALKRMQKFLMEPLPCFITKEQEEMVKMGVKVEPVPREVSPKGEESLPQTVTTSTWATPQAIKIDCKRISMSVSTLFNRPRKAQACTPQKNSSQQSIFTILPDSNPRAPNKRTVRNTRASKKTVMPTPRKANKQQGLMYWSSD